MKKLNLNKKGFTLVELIAVIAILSILMVLALPSVINLFNQGRTSAFVTQAQSIYKAAEESFIADQISPDSTTNSITYCYDGTTTGTETLDISGNDEVYYKIVFTNGVMTSFHVADASHSIELTSSPKINDIDEPDATLKAVTCAANNG